MGYFGGDKSEDIYTRYKMAEFISEEAFQRAVEEQVHVISWSDVPIDRIYKIEEIVPGRSNYGQQFILKLTSSDGKSYRAWSTSLLRDELMTISEHKRNHLFIKPKGLCRTKKNPDKEFHRYELVNFD